MNVGVGIGSALDADAGRSAASIESPLSVSGGQGAPSVRVSDTDAPTVAATPKVSHQTVELTEAIAFGMGSIDDPGRDVGTSTVTTAGQNGLRTSIWDVVFTDGIETGRSLLSETTTTEPVTQITSEGTRQPEPEAVPEPAAAPEPEVVPEPEPEPASGVSGCDPNYEGACVPIDSDVDCADGNGNGPSYVEGPVYVVGDDIYGLDRNNDGVGCE